MSTAMEEVKSMLSQLGNRMTNLEKVQTDRSVVNKDATRAARALENVLLGRRQDNGGSNGALNWDGSDALVYTVHPGCQKSIGKVVHGGATWDFTEYLRLVYDGCTGKNVEGVEKRLEEFGSVPITKARHPVTKAALAENSGATGGYTIPVQFYAQLMQFEPEATFAADKCTIIQASGREVQIPVLDQTITPSGAQSAYFAGITWTWGTPEGTALSESEPAFRQANLVTQDLQFTSVASNQMLQDNVVALDTLLTTVFRNGMAWAKDYYILRGSGVGGEPLGILNSAATFSESRTTGSRFKLQDAADMIARILPNHLGKCCWVIRPEILSELIKMENPGNTALVWINQSPSKDEGGMAGKMPMTLLGLPIFVTEKLPALGVAGDVLLVDFSAYIIADRMQLQIEVSREFLFNKNQTMWRIVARYTGRPWPNATLILNDGSYQVSPMVMLAA